MFQVSEITTGANTYLKNIASLNILGHWRQLKGKKMLVFLFSLMVLWSGAPRRLTQYVVLYCEAVAQTAQRTWGCPNPGSTWGQAGWGPGQPGLVGGRGLELHGLCGPFQPKPSYDSVFLMTRTTRTLPVFGTSLSHLFLSTSPRPWFTHYPFLQ